jgi:NADH:ubiquinone oxidoreductase subunit 4 (subunit M)
MLLPLRFPRVWLTLGWVFVALALVACLVPGGVPGTAGVNDKFMHVIGYLALTIWFTGMYPRSRYAVIALSLLAMGVLVEVLQGAMRMGRVAEVADVYADAAGIAVGLLLAVASLGGWTQRVEAWMAARE